MLFKRASLVLLPMMLWSFSTRANSFELKPLADVDSQGIFLEHLVTGKDIDRLSNIYLAPAPAWGQTRILKKAELIQLLATNAPAIASSEFLGASEVKITRKSKKLEEKELLKLLTEKLQPKGRTEKAGILDLRLGREWKPVPVPVEPIELRIVLQPPSLTAHFMVRFDVVAGEELVGTYSVFFNARLLKEVWVARSAIKRGTLMDQADLEKEQRDVINVREGAWTGLTLDSSAQLTENISAGGIVYARAVQQRPVIQRGQQLQAVASDGVLTVSIKVEALENGATDDFIRVRNIKTRKELRGKVINEDTIQVTF
jgi:flagella basal body P-ring formation protein FlgA